MAESTEASASFEKSPSQGHSVLHKIAFYLPNRVLDILDIVRVRARVGPGVAVGVRATKYAQGYLGSYASVYAGLPGPRLRRFPVSPIGLESYNGAAVSLVEATAGGGIGPNYSPTEFGVTLQAGVIGFDLGIDPYEIIDFGLGIIGLDPRDDDL